MQDHDSLTVNTDPRHNYVDDPAYPTAYTAHSGERRVHTRCTICGNVDSRLEVAGKRTDFSVFYISTVDEVEPGETYGYNVQINRITDPSGTQGCDTCGERPGEYYLDASEDLGTQAMVFEICQDCMVWRFNASTHPTSDDTFQEKPTLRVDGDFEVKAHNGVVHHFTKVDNDQNRNCESAGMCDPGTRAVYKIESTDQPTEYACQADAESIMDQLA